MPLPLCISFFLPSPHYDREWRAALALPLALCRTPLTRTMWREYGGILPVHCSHLYIFSLTLPLQNVHLEPYKETRAQVTIPLVTTTYPYAEGVLSDPSRSNQSNSCRSSRQHHGSGYVVRMGAWWQSRINVITFCIPECLFIYVSWPTLLFLLAISESSWKRAL